MRFPGLPCFIEIFDRHGVFWHSACDVFSVTHRTTPSMNTSTPLRNDARPLHDPIATGDGLQCDTSLKFVRVIEERADGLVAFEFSIGWPELAVELLLPAQAFVEFCTTQRVRRLD